MHKMYNKYMAEQGDKSPGNFFTEPISRRESFSRIVKIVGAASGLALSLYPNKDVSARNIPQKEFASFDDLLSDEQLQAAHIRIIQAPSVKLRLRKGIFDFPIFHDAKEGRLKEVAIVLIDHPNLSWNASNKMPEDAKLAFQAHCLNPAEATESYWKVRQENEKVMKSSYKEMQKTFKEQLDKTNAELKTLIADRDETLRQLSTVTDDYQRKLLTNQLSNQNGMVKTWGKLVLIDSQLLSNARSGEIDAELKLLELMWDRDRVIQKESEDSDVTGQFVKPGMIRIIDEEGEKKAKEQDPEGFKRYKRLLQEHPELQGKVFIFLAVGGKKKPDPTDSYPSPDKYKDMEVHNLQEAEAQGRYRFFGPYTAGSIFRHEASHYGDGEFARSEYEADTGGFESVVRAWETKQTTGRTDGYPIVFITSEGITVTKNTSQLSPKQSV